MNATTTTHLRPQSTSPSTWQSALYAFLAEKERRSGSMRTVHAYSAMLQQFFGQVGNFRQAGINASGVHVLRHTGAKLRREAGESVEEVSQFLDHSRLAVTSVYLKRLEGEKDTGWSRVAAAIGVAAG